MSYDVVDATVLQRLGVRPDLDELGVPRQLAYWQTRPGADEVDDWSDGRTKTVSNVAFRLERLALDLQISCTRTRNKNVFVSSPLTDETTRRLYCHAYKTSCAYKLTQFSPARR